LKVRIWASKIERRRKGPCQVFTIPKLQTGFAKPAGLKRNLQNYKDVGFTTNYLGHIIHYLEGVIYNIRNKGELK